MGDRLVTGRQAADTARKGAHRSAAAAANALDKLTSLGAAQLVAGKPSTYRLAVTLAPAQDAVGDPGTSAEAEPGAA